jgi:hypothetical protein
MHAIINVTVAAAATRAPLDCAGNRLLNNPRSSHALSPGRRNASTGSRQLARVLLCFSTRSRPKMPVNAGRRPVVRTRNGSSSPPCHHIVKLVVRCGGSLPRQGLLSREELCMSMSSFAPPPPLHSPSNNTDNALGIREYLCWSNRTRIRWGWRPSRGLRGLRRPLELGNDWGRARRV